MVKDVTTLPAEKLAELAVKFSTAVELIEPEAKTMVDSCKKEPVTTKNNYGKVLATISGLPGSMQVMFLYAMVKNGYDSETAKQIAEIQGLAKGYENLCYVLK